MIIILNNLRPDSDDFEALYNHYFNYVYTICYNILHQIEGMEDLLQNIFTILYQTMGRIKDIESARPWVATIAKNAALNALKKDQTYNKRFAEIDNELLYQLTIDEDDSNPLKIVVDEESVAFIYNEIKALGATYSEVLILKYKYGFNTDEIMKLLGLNPGTVYSKIDRGRKLLKKRLTDAQRKGGVRHETNEFGGASL